MDATTTAIQDRKRGSMRRDEFPIVDKYVKKQVNEVLDKIRSEIDMARFIDKDTKTCKNALASGLEVAMQIIDKYKTESEEV